MADLPDFRTSADDTCHRCPHSMPAFHGCVDSALNSCGVDGQEYRRALFVQATYVLHGHIHRLVRLTTALSLQLSIARDLATPTHIVQHSLSAFPDYSGGA